MLCAQPLVGRRRPERGLASQRHLLGTLNPEDGGRAADSVNTHGGGGESAERSRGAASSTTGPGGSRHGPSRGLPLAAALGATSLPACSLCHHPMSAVNHSGDAGRRTCPAQARARGSVGANPKETSGDQTGDRRGSWQAWRARARGAPGGR